MTANTLTRAAGGLGEFLRDRRARLRPAEGGQTRRRTPGLRREEVAARAGVSVTWYTWLEQGRGGPPSVQVLERLARALELDAESRELLFLLAQQRPAPISAAPTPEAPPNLAQVLDAMPKTPALVMTRTGDVVAWNRAAATVLTDYGALAPEDRNVLRRLFLDPAMKRLLADWEGHARFAVAAFRYDAARIGGSVEADALVAELAAASADFRRLWAEKEVRAHGAGVKRFVHPQHGALTLKTSSFAVNGAEGLTLLVFTPATAADAAVLETLLAEGAAGATSWRAGLGEP